LASARTGNEFHRGNANTGTGTWQVLVLEMNSIAAVPILVRALGKVSVLEMNSIVAVPIPVWAPDDAQYWN
jgi:hypothetical protein